MGASSSSPTLEAIQGDKYGMNNLFNKSKANDASAILKALTAFKDQCATHTKGMQKSNDLLLMSIFVVQINQLRTDMESYKGNRTLDPSNQYVRAVSTASMKAEALIEQFKTEKYGNAAIAPSFSTSGKSLDKDIQFQIELNRKNNYSSGTPAELDAMAARMASRADELISVLTPGTARATFTALKVAETQLNFEPNFNTKVTTIQKLQAAQQTAVALLDAMKVTSWK